MVRLSMSFGHLLTNISRLLRKCVQCAPCHVFYGIYYGVLEFKYDCSQLPYYVADNGCVCVCVSVTTEWEESSYEKQRLVENGKYTEIIFGF